MYVYVFKGIQLLEYFLQVYLENLFFIFTLFFENPFTLLPSLQSYYLLSAIYIIGRNKNYYIFYINKIQIYIPIK